MKLEISLGPGAEFDLIRRFLGSGRVRPGEGLAGLRAAVRVGPGDDCAILDVGGVQLAVSTDLTVEGVHFRREWISMREAGYRAAMAALSDLAAVAARPVGVLVSLATPGPEPAEAEDLMEGVREALVEVGGELLGGDVARSSAGVCVDVVAIGETQRPVLRHGAQPGDEVWVTGELGASAAAVAAWRAGREPAPEAKQAFAKPRPRIAEAAWLVERDVPTAMIDLSDGLAGDARHLAAAGGVAIVLDETAIPVHPAAADGGVRMALGGGEDYELCFTARPGRASEVAADFEEQFGVRLTRVGDVEAGTGVALRRVDGTRAPLDVAGFDHFAGGGS